MKVPFVHLGDVHLGGLLSGGLAGRQVAERRAEALATLQKCLKYIQEHKIPLLFVAGDLFEYETTSRQTVMELCNMLGDISPTHVFIAAGNHDYAAANSFYRTLSWPANVHLFLDDWQSVHLPEFAVTVHGMGFTTPELTSRHLQEYQIANDDRLHVIILHADLISGASDSRYLPIHRNDLQQCGADYVALGHIHKPQVVLESDGKAVAAYCGALEPMRFGEEGEHGFYHGQLAAGGADLQFVPMATRSYHTKTVDITGCQTTENVISRITEALNSISPKDLVSVVLTGHIDTDFYIEKDRIEQAGADFYHFQMRDETQPAYDLEELAKGFTARAVFVRRMQALLATAEGEQKDEVRLALHLGLQALSGQEVRLP